MSLEAVPQELVEVDSHFGGESGGVERVGRTLQTNLALGAAEEVDKCQVLIVAFNAWHSSLNFAVVYPRGGPDEYAAADCFYAALTEWRYCLTDILAMYLLCLGLSAHDANKLAVSVGQGPSSLLSALPVQLWHCAALDFIGNHQAAFDVVVASRLQCNKGGKRGDEDDASTPEFVSYLFTMISKKLSCSRYWCFRHAYLFHHTHGKGTMGKGRRQKLWRVIAHDCT